QGAIGVYRGALLPPHINGSGLLILDTIFVGGTSLRAGGGGWTLILVGVFMGMVPSLYGNFWEILGLDDRLSFHLSLFEGLSCALLKRTLAAFYDNYEKLKETIQENKARLKKITDELLKPQRILMEVR
ncbi:MAG: hypothetical protein VYA34_00370, partial [Myxococcota bacterium]|nr:hypothetical protein [Myxococcota bacterium]